MTRRSPPRPARQRGAALLLALLLGLTVALMFAFRPGSDGKAGRNQRSESALADAKVALIGYAATYREAHRSPPPAEDNLGYLPCPDLDNSGTAAGNCSTSGVAVVGRLPYKTLGIPPLRTADGECLWYIVAGTHKNNPKTTPLNWDTRSTLRIEDTAGQSLAAPDAEDGGPVAIIIDPGTALLGQARPANADCASGINQDITSQAANFIDAFDAATQRLTLPAAGPANNTHNDRANWINARELFSTVAKRNDLIDTLPTELFNCLNLTASNSIPSNAAQFEVIGSERIVGPTGIQNVVTQRACVLTPSATTLLANWANQFRYIVCNPVDSLCLNVDGATCSGALLFAGKHARGPRTAAELATPASLFDTGNAAALTQAAANTLLTSSDTGTGYLGLKPERDLAFCLQPASPGELSFAQNFDNLAAVAPDINGQRMVRLDDARRVLQLGEEGLRGNEAGVSPALLFGCSWFATPLNFNAGLRAYFRYRILNRGEGFVFTLADATRNPDTQRCGSGSSSLGYSGLPNAGDDVPGLSLQAIRPPKIGLEIDTRRTLAREDNNANHIAIVYWGDPALPDDDNVHFAPIPPIAGVPANAAPVTRSITNDEDVNLHVRLEIVRTRTASGSNYLIKAWLLNYLPPTFTDLQAPFDQDIVAAHLNTSTSIADLAANEEALRTIRIGFTNAASATSDQLIEISNFAIQTQR